MEDMDMTGVTKEKFGDSSRRLAKVAICGEISNLGMLPKVGRPLDVSPRLWEGPPLT